MTNTPASVGASTVGEVLLSVKDVRLTLGTHLILDGVSFDVLDRIRAGTCTGQIVSLLGPSGVGKTRLLRIIAALDTPDSGGVTGVNGANMEAGQVGVVFQDYPLLRHRTVQGNLALAGTMAGLSATAARERAAKLLSTFRLDERADFFPAQLSGGQRQRVAIAQQLVVPRHLLLMDEPFSGLDPAALEDVIQLIVSVANEHEQNTIVIVTHDIRAAMIVSDTIYMLGRDHKEGVAVPGARIKRTVDLVELGLAWRAGVEETREFLTLERELRHEFRGL